MAETQVAEITSTEEEIPEDPKSRSRRYKASNMSFEEMVEMVAILRREDYDAKHGPYKRPNLVKTKIMGKVVKTLHQKFGVCRTKEQLRKRWSDLKLREPDQYKRIKKVIGKRLQKATSDEPRNPTPSTIPPEPHDGEEREVVEVESGTTRGAVLAGDPEKFTHHSAQILIQYLMVCCRDLEKIKGDLIEIRQNTKRVEEKLQKIMAVLGRV